MIIRIDVKVIFIKNNSESRYTWRSENVKTCFYFSPVESKWEILILQRGGKKVGDNV